MKEQLHSILERLIIKNNIRVNQEELKLQLFSHPSYPSLHALTGVLDHLGVSNLALRLPLDTATLQQLPPYWIAQIDQGQGVELVLIECKNEHYKIYTNGGKAKKINAADFLTIWTGIMLAIEKDEQTIEIQQVSSQKIIQWSLYLLGFISLSFFLYTTAHFFPIAHSLLSILGLVLSIFIIRHELGLQSLQTNRLCNLSSSTSCDAVLHSKGATLFGLLKLSDVSILSFSTYLICWLLFALTNHSEYSFIYTLALLALPFTIYSIYYQAKVIKKWCPLCLGIVVILILQATILLPVNDLNFVFDWTAMLYFSSSLLLSSALWLSLRALLQDRLAYRKLQVDHNKFKRNFSLFDTLFRKEQIVQHSINIPGEIIFGVQEAPLEIILVTNPLCHYCKEAHQAMEQVLRQAKKQVKLIIRFSVDVSNADNIGYKIAQQLLHIYTTEGSNACLKAMAQVYQDQADLNKWLGLQTKPTSKNYHSILSMQNDWCQNNAINFTPALYLNGRQYPNEYLKRDLIYFLDDLIETQHSYPTTNKQMITSSS